LANPRAHNDHYAKPLWARGEFGAPLLGRCGSLVAKTRPRGAGAPGHARAAGSGLGGDRHEGHDAGAARRPAGAFSRA